MKGKMVYIAGPLDRGDQAINVRTAIDVAHALANQGYVPVVPHLSWFWHLVYPRPRQWWLDYTQRLLLGCDILVRLPGESEGADDEVRMAMELGKTVYLWPSWTRIFGDEKGGE